MPDDIPAMMAIESDPCFEGLVFHWPLERHAEEMALPSSLYFVLRGPEQEIAGFALVQGIGDPDRKLHLKRIAVTAPGGGLGSVLLQGVLARLFGETEANRVDLHVFVGNDRARRAYEKVGFQLEGVLRDYHRQADGAFRSMWLMSVLRRDWEAQPPNRLPTSKL